MRIRDSLKKPLYSCTCIEQCTANSNSSPIHLQKRMQMHNYRKTVVGLLPTDDLSRTNQSAANAPRPAKRERWRRHCLRVQALNKVTISRRRYVCACHEIIKTEPVFLLQPFLVHAVCVCSRILPSNKQTLICMGWTEKAILHSRLTCLCICQSTATYTLVAFHSSANCSGAHEIIEPFVWPQTIRTIHTHIRTFPATIDRAFNC